MLLLCATAWMPYSTWLLHLFLTFLCWGKVNADHAPKCFQSLYDMKCQNLSIHSIPSSLSNNIKMLDLSYNLITKLTNTSFSNLYNLKHLNIYYNHLETIEYGALDTLSQLQSLNLASNRMHKHYSSHKGVFDNLQSLKILNLANNNLDSDMVHCYLSNCYSLINLDLSRNAIIILFSGMFAGVPQLSELDLSNNYIVEIEKGTFNLLKDLRVLNLAVNAIHCISGFDLPQLHVLNLSSNSLEFFLSPNSRVAYKLRTLDLSQNNLVYFPVLPKFHMVQNLNLSGNNMGELIPSSNETEHSLRSPYEAVAKLDIPGTIENVISQLKHLIHLDLSNNQLAKFPWYFLSNMSTLQNLNIAQNCLYNITDVYSNIISKNITSREEMKISLQSLRVLDLQENSIQYIPPWLFEKLPGIEHINLRNNNIRFCSSNHNERGCSNFSGAHNLHYLNLQNNSIQNLLPNVFYCTSLLSLDLSHNVGLTIHAGALQEVEQTLQILSLNRNLMNDSQANLPCLKWLRFLDLSYNRLNKIPPNVTCSSMESINLQNNYIHHLDERVLLFANRLKNMSISSNPFDCCSLNWLNDLFIANVNILDLETAHCIYANSKTNIPVNELIKHNKYCYHWTGNGYLIAVIIILLMCPVFSLCFMIQKCNRKFCIMCTFRSNKIASEIPSSITSVKAEAKQVCFTVSSK